MTDINLQTITPDTTLPTTGFLFGADSQASGSPSVYTVQSVATTLLGSTTLTGATITTSQPVLDLAQTWNAGGVTFTGLKLNATDTASASASLLMDLQVGGSSRFSVAKAGSANFANDVLINNSNGLRLNSSGGYIMFGLANDIQLYRDAANILAQRNGVNAQAFRLYNTYTDASNYERLDLLWSGNEVFIRTMQTGTGTPRAMYVGTAGSAKLTFFVNSVDRWTINTSGHFLAATDNAYDIGASGATRPRIGYFGTGILSPYFQFNSEGRISSLGDGIVRFTNAALNDFNRMVFGGSTSAFPALKRSSASLIVRLADDSANAALESASLKTDAPAGGTAATWKLGTVASVSPTLPNRTIEVDIGGTIYYISAKTTNN